MITEDYVSFETAKLLKEKGFNEVPVHTYYLSYGGFYLAPMAVTNKDLYAHGHIAAPTLQMAMKWLREVHKIDISVDPYKGEKDWIYLFHICQNKDYLFSKCIDASYENCTEAAIKYCLENLI